MKSIRSASYGKAESQFHVSSALVLLMASFFSHSAANANVFGPRQLDSRLLWTAVQTDIAPIHGAGGSADVLSCIGRSHDLCSFGVYDLELQLVSGNRWYEPDLLREGRSHTGGADQNHVWVSYTRNDSLFVQDVWRSLEMLVTVGQDIAPPRGWDGKVQDAVLADINHDGRLELVVAVIAGMDNGPRGIFTFEWDTGRLLWKYLVGPAISPPLLVRDFDGDSLKEIAFVTNAYCNGNVANGTDDCHTYVFALSANGELRWLKPVSDIPSEMIAAFLDEADTSLQRIVVAEKGGANRGRVRDSIWVLNQATHEVMAAAQWGRYNHSLAALSDRRGNRLVALGGSDDTLRILDSKLRLRRKRRTSGGSINLVCSGQFGRAGEELLAVATSDGVLLIYDTELKLRCRVNSGGIGTMSAIWDGAHDKLLAPFGAKSEWGLYEFTEPPLLGQRISLAVLLLSIGALLIAFALILVYVRYRQTQDIRSVIRSLTGRAGTIELNRRGEVTSTNQKARELLGIREKRVMQIPTQGPFASVSELAKAMLAEPEGAPPREMVVSTAPGQTSMVRCVRVKTGAVLTIEDISAVEYLQRVKAWAPVAQKLAHGIKNPLNTILGSVEQIELKVADEKALKYMGYVKDEVTRLRKMADAFMRFTKLNPPTLEPKNVNEVIKKAIAKYECRMTNRATRQDAENPDSHHQDTKAPGYEEEPGANRQDAKNAKEDGFNTKTQRYEGESGSTGIELRLELDEKLPAIALDEEGLSNALEIVIENAVEAMEGGEQIAGISKRIRTLNVRTTPSDSPPGTPGVPGGEKREFVRIEITDTGKGIPQKYLDKVFDPYFTYGKPSGTGLGLSLAKKIVEDHHGRIEIHSIEGRGTEVDIYLPAKA
jgi:signal transduction histidine kinase/PAS domain-containing protein